jgi:hypothetical protein
VVLPLLLAVAVGVGVWQVWESYHDLGTRWTAAGAVAAGGAFVAAVIGVPIALSQLFAVERDVARLTKAGDAEKKLLEQVRLGTFLAMRLHATSGQEAQPTAEEAPRGVPDFASWVDQATSVIRQIADDNEGRMFHLAGAAAQPRDQLDAKLAYMRNDLWPKVRAGFSG